MVTTMLKYWCSPDHFKWYRTILSGVADHYKCNPGTALSRRPTRVVSYYGAYPNHFQAPTPAQLYCVRGRRHKTLLRFG